MKRVGLLRGFASAAMALMLASCALMPPPRDESARYDLGPPPHQERANPALSAIVLLPDVTAPSWLDGKGIVFRLAYEKPARLQTYAQSRWKAPPPALLSERLRGRFAAATQRGIVTSDDGARADYKVRVALEDFSQTFSAPGTSRVVVRARASVVNLQHRTLVAQRVFVFERPAPSPDARGAVAALADASDELIEELLEWTSEQLRAAAGPGRQN
ncbi:MAG: ABC-type transport auxiliary lipoprotein family protein [Betaproteobacteria bacterium]|nr:ABC-type transport auxiliary lipoprotein family protein [Betaproteobacteria bacterium]MDH3437407.1 ABC-type transport auxiliary lipoprotein family protein [Betaproteobacteria bacterium]